MARDEDSREDLLREATALVQRVELQVEGFAEPIVAGFRRDGAASFYFGQRCFISIQHRRPTPPRLSRRPTVQSRSRPIGAIDAPRTADEVDLLRHECKADEEREFLAIDGPKTIRVATSVWSRVLSVLGQIPPDGNVAGRVGDWLSIQADPIPLACSPHAK